VKTLLYKNLKFANNLFLQVWGLWEQNKIMELLDKTLALPNSEPELLSELKRCINIGLLCVQEMPGDRPAMSVIVAMLTSTTSHIDQPRSPVMGSMPTTSSHDHETDPSSPIPTTTDLT
jgi:hypothetical protein